MDKDLKKSIKQTQEIDKTKHLMMDTKQMTMETITYDDG